LTGKPTPFFFSSFVFPHKPRELNIPILFFSTVNGTSISNRHQFFKKCIGTAARAKNDKERFITLDKAARDLRLKTINLLKIDIEG